MLIRVCVDFMIPSKKKVDSIGEKLRLIPNDEESLDILSAWRGSYIYPLGLAFNLLKRYTDKIGNNAVYGQRLKRVNSILHKLNRMPDIKLSRMQDIGGCRVILSDYEQLRKLYLNLRKSSSILPNYKDYITYPKADGYRGIHLIYQCNSKNSNHNGLKIELQLRTKLQHAWATAVEIVDLFEGEQLKLGRGSAEWSRLFYLIADEFARLENLPFHDNTIKNRTDEIKQLCNHLNIVGKLKGYTSTIESKDLNSKRTMDFEFCILVIHNKFGYTTLWRVNDQAKALNLYIEFEKSFMDSPEINVLMVKMSSIKQIKAAYPNYFANSRRFLENLTTILNT